MSKKGTSTFIMQRASAVVLLPLAIWFLFSLVSLASADSAAARAWFSVSMNGLLFGAFIIIGAWHMRIGMAEIIADYIEGGLKPVLELINWAVAVAIIGGAAMSVYTLSFAG